MSYPPSSPPPGPYGSQQPSYGPHGSHPGHGHGGPGGPGGPGYSGPGGPGGPGQGEPPRKGVHPGIIAGIVGVALLALLVCCLGGYLLFLSDDEDGGDASETTTSETSESETSEPTTESETSEPVTETETETVDPSSPSTPGGTAVDFPDSFDGWSSTSGSTDTFALYTKGGDNFNVIASEYSTVESYERIWDSTSTHGDISCGSRGSSGSVHCAGEKDGTTFLATSIGLSDSDLADALEKLLEEV